MKYLNINESLIDAVIRQDIDAVRGALSQGADINYQDYSVIGSGFGVTALSEACWRDSDAIFYLLLGQDGIDVNISDENSATPLHKLAVMGDVSRVKALLEKGADVNFVDNRGENVLDIAETCDNKEVLFVLKNSSIGTVRTNRRNYNRKNGLGM